MSNLPTGLKENFTVKNYLVIGIGGMIGTSLRYLLSFIFWAEFSGFPLATLIANLTGAYLLTFILFYSQIKLKWNSTTVTALTTGLIGSYTTFSTITIEVVILIRESFFITAFYLVLTIFGGLFCSLLGYKTAKGDLFGGTVK